MRRMNLARTCGQFSAGFGASGVWLLNALFILTRLSATADGYDVCSSIHSATFESGTNGLSGYTNVATDDFNWTLGTGDTPTSFTGPSGDHTLGTTSGHYVYIEDNDASKDKNAVLRSPLLTTNALQEECYVQFYYNMRGSNIGTLLVSTQLRGSLTTTAVWHRSGGQCTGSDWKLASARLPRGTAGDFYVLFKGVTVQRITLSQTGDIAIDDISVTCCAGCTKSTFGLGDFSSGLVSFTQSKTDNFDWSRDMAGTPSDSTGPAYDFTTGYPGCTASNGGSYMYIEASGKMPNVVATLISPIYQPATKSQVCFVSFWYNMYGTGIGSLSVSTDLSSTDTTQWCRNGQQMDSNTAWRRGQFWVQPQGTAFKVVLSGKVASGSGQSQGDTAIDDVSVSCCTETCDYFYPATFECGLDGFTGSWTRRNGLLDKTTGLSTGHTLLADEGTTSKVANWTKTIRKVSSSGSTCTLLFYVSATLPKDHALTVSALTQST